MEVNEKILASKIKNEIKKYEILKKSFLKLCEIEEKANIDHSANYNNFNNIIGGDNTELQNIYNKYVDTMRSLRNDSDVHLKKIDDLIIPVTEIYPKKINASKLNLERTFREKYNKLNVANNNNNASGAFDEEFVKFESERLEDNKCLFLHYIHSELKYHAAAVEKLSKLFREINEIEPLEKLEEFAQKLKIDTDLKALGIDVDEIKKQNIKKKNDKNKNVYDDEDFDDEIEDEIDNKDKIKESKNTGINNASENI